MLDRHRSAGRLAATGGCPRLRRRGRPPGTSFQPKDEVEIQGAVTIARRGQAAKAWNPQAGRRPAEGPSTNGRLLQLDRESRKKKGC